MKLPVPLARSFQVSRSHDQRCIALFGCPHCIDEFAFDWQRIRNLMYGWRVRVRCPGCGNIVTVVMQGYTVIHHCDPAKYR